MLACPTCSKRLIRSDTPNGIMFPCPSCGGKAVNLAVLRRLVAPEFLQAFVGSLFSGTSRPTFSSRRCPHCMNPMTTTRVPVQCGELALDFCRRCQVVWFDPNEMESVPVATGPPRRARPKLTDEQAQKLGTALAEMRQESEDLGALDLSRAPTRPEHAWQYIPAVLGLPVETDVSPLARLPLATWGLVLAVVVEMVMLTAGGALRYAIEDWGFMPARWWRHDGLTLITSFGLHAGWWHLVGNMYFLLIFGDNVEDYLGKARFLLLLLGSHLTGLCLHGAIAPGANVPCVGASAGIAGVIAFYAIVFPRAKLLLAPTWWFFMFYGMIRMSALMALGLFVLYQILLAVLQFEGLSNVSAMAHLGGLAVGIAAGLVARANSQRLKPGSATLGS